MNHPTFTSAIFSTKEGFEEYDIPIPSLETHDLLVEIKAVSLNPVDTKVRARSEEEQILGWDASGVVIAVGGGVEDFSVGDEVFYAGSLERPGTNTQYHIVDSRLVAKKPHSLTHAEAAALPLTAITAWEGLFDKFGLEKAVGISEGDSRTLLVVGAAGGVGSVLIQLVKELTSLRVVALASREESTSWLQELGADAVYDYTDPCVADQIKNFAARYGNAAGIDYVFSGQTQGKLPLIVDVVRPFGEIVVIDDPQDVDMSLLKSKALTWHWEFMFARSRWGWDMPYQGQLLQDFACLVDTGRIKTTLRTVMPLNAQNIAKAHSMIREGHTVGKIVLEAPSSCGELH